MNKSIKNYILNFLKKERISSKSDLVMIGCIVSNHTLLDRVKNENINIDEIIALAKRKEFDVRTDDLIYLYFVRDEAKCYIAFIYDPWEVFSATPLLKMLKVNYEDIANKIDLSLTL